MPSNLLYPLAVFRLADDPGVERALEPEHSARPLAAAPAGAREAEPPAFAVERALIPAGRRRGFQKPGVFLPGRFLTIQN